MKTNYILLVLVLCMPKCLRHICQFWDTITLFKPVKGASKGALTRDKSICHEFTHLLAIAKMDKTGQNLAFSMLKGALAWS